MEIPLRRASMAARTKPEALADPCYEGAQLGISGLPVFMRSSQLKSAMKATENANASRHLQRKKIFLMM